jgi:hypothetical protein
MKMIGINFLKKRSSIRRICKLKVKKKLKSICEIHTKQNLIHMPLYYCDFQLPVLAYIFGATIWLGKSKSKRDRERLQYIGKEARCLGTYI